MEGLGNTACSLECLACLNHVHGWTIWGGYGTASQTPLSRSIGSLASCSATGPFGSGDLGSLNSNSTRAEPAWFPSLCPVVMHSPVTGLFRVLLDRFLLPTIRPRFQEQRTTGHTQSALHSALQCMEDGLAQNAWQSTVPVRQQVSGVLLLRPTTRRYDRFSHHRASQGHAQS